jgi:hypothetical protein
MKKAVTFKSVPDLLQETVKDSSSTYTIITNALQDKERLIGELMDRISYMKEVIDRLEKDKERIIKDKDAFIAELKQDKDYWHKEYLYWLKRHEKLWKKNQKLLDKLLDKQADNMAQRNAIEDDENDLSTILHRNKAVKSNNKDISKMTDQEINQLIEKKRKK